MSDEKRWGGLNYLREKDLAPRAITPQNAYLMTDIMSDVVRRGTAAKASLLKRGDLAGKTGTTNDGRDAWFCGFNAGLVGTAWVGFDQERPLGAGEEGSRTALPMWMYFMGEVMRGVPEQKRVAPPGIVTMRVSSTSGAAASPGEPNSIFEYFMAGHLPPEVTSEGGVTRGGDSSEGSADESLF
jgi:penicillin-binding protein 1A